MKIIFSHWDANHHFFVNPNIAKLSHDLVKNHGYKTCLFTDLKGYNSLAEHVNYDEIIFFDEKKLSLFYNKIWSLGKLLAASQMNEPFIHIDFDMLLFKPLNTKLINQDFISMYEEQWLHKDKNFNAIVEKVCKILLKDNFYDINQFKSYNFSLFGGTKYKEISFVSNKIIEFSILYRKELEQIYNENFSKKTWILAVIFEQILIPFFLKNDFNIENFNLVEFTNNDFNFIKKTFKEFCIENRIVHLSKNKDIIDNLNHLI